jgi:tetraacyldisaccharide 4'-kinase
MEGAFMDEVDFLRLVSGERRGAWPTAQRAGLSLLSVAYRLGVGLNGLAHSAGMKPRHRIDVPVVSIGNLTTGGTGKTPFVAHVVDALRARGARPAILSRGYRADADGTNDERRVLDALCPGVPHLQAPDRVASARRAIDEHRADVLVLDDGFQHRRLGRDVDIVLIDALQPWGFGRLLPRGLLREPLAALRRADVVVLTRVDQCSTAERTAIVERLQRVRGTPAHVAAAFPPRVLVDAEGRTAALETIGDAHVTAFCGIGNPSAFRRSLEAEGVRVGGFIAFPDHHHFTAADLAAIRAEADRHRSSLVLCTEKDLVKVCATKLGNLPLRAVRIGVSIRQGEELLTTALERCRVPPTRTTPFPDSLAS